jgi:hypothetical protein
MQSERFKQKLLQLNTDIHAHVTYMHMTFVNYTNISLKSQTICDAMYTHNIYPIDKKH